MSDTRKLILQNTLIENLSKYFRLIPQNKFEEVQKKVFKELKYEKCTKDQCIMIIQKILQVENLFVLQIIGKKENTQMSLKWVGLDDKKIKTNVCVNYRTFELNTRVKELIKKLETVIPKKIIVVKNNDEKLRKKKEEKLKRQRQEEL